jgi:hypothetical protein
VKIKGVRSYEEFWVMLPIKSLIFILWSFLALISLNHLYRFWDGLVFSTFFLGVLGWITIFITLIYLSKQFIKQSLLIFLIFFCIGYFLGPYLEPPGDPIDHLKRTYSYCDKSSNRLSKKNRGLWHFSMSTNFLCSSEKSTSPEITLRRIDLLHGVYWGILTVGLFILSKSVGLPDRWAFLSCLIAFLFFGTNRFSYFSYYSLAPSFTSLLLYWLWTATYFFKKNWKDLFYGLLLALISLPILIVNHMQEAVFMGFIVSIWLFCNLHERIWHWLTHFQIWLKIGYFLILFVFLFVLPQFEFFQRFLSQGFERNLWKNNQQAVFCWQGFHLIGKIWSYRINDTLGIMSVIPIIISIPLFWPNLIQINNTKKIKIFILGILPFVGYAIPLFNFIWVSNNKIATYYRLCYSSMFWIPIAFFLYSFGERCARTFTVRSFKTLYFAGCLMIIILITGIRSGPVYGKLDFILLNTRPWWNEWKPMIYNLMKKDRKPIYSDALTSNVLKNVFNYPSARYRRSVIKIEAMDNSKTAQKYRCMINLHGFTPSWVPRETRHWRPDSANTSLYYQYNGISGEELKDILKENPPKNCEVYF